MRIRIKMNRGISNIFLLIFFFLFFININPAHAIPAQAPAMVLDRSFYKTNLSAHSEFFEDRSGNLSVEQIRKPDFRDSFKMLGNKSPILGFTSSAIWLRFRVSNTTPNNMVWFLEIPGPDYDSIDIYAVRNGKSDLIQRGGDRFPFYMREIKFRNFIFKIIEEPRSDTAYYVRLRTSSSIELMFTAWSQEALLRMMPRDQVLMGLYYGAMIIMLIFNLFLFVSMRDRNYLYYILFLASFIFFQLGENGLAFQYLWPGSVWWTNNSLSLFILLAIIFMILFTRSFLSIRDYFPRYDRILLLVFLFTVLYAPLSFYFGYTCSIRISIIDAVVTSVVSIVAAVLVLVRGYRPARYYLMSWLFFFITIILYSLETFSFIPLNRLMFIGPHVSSLFVVVFMSFALSDRINFMKKDLERFNTDLENLVDERTNELNDAIQNLEKRDRDLQIELELAGTIQKGILPSTPFYSDGIKIDSYYSSMGKVGGDFFDFFPMPGGHLGVLIADVSGHGMPAAFITALAKISFSETIKTSIFPSEIFSRVNTELVDAIKTDDFVTAFFMVISPTFEVFYCNASHQKPLLLRKRGGPVDAWDTGGLFLGAMLSANEMYEDGRDALNYGDRLLFYTDGMVDSVGDNREKFGEERLKELFADTAGLSFNEAMAHITSSWKQYVRESEAVDDVTFLLIELDPRYREVAEHRERGYKLLGSGQYEEAISELQKALEVNPDDEKSHLYIGECYLNYGNYALVIEHLERYLKNNDVDANVWLHLAKAHFILGDYHASGRASLKSAQLRSDHIEAQVIFGLSMKKIGNADEAERAWKRVLRIDPHNKVARKELDGLARGR